MIFQQLMFYLTRQTAEEIKDQIKNKKKTNEMVGWPQQQSQQL